jgi:hypothetical protein
VTTHGANVDECIKLALREPDTRFTRGLKRDDFRGGFEIFECETHPDLVDAEYHLHELSPQSKAYRFEYLRLLRVIAWCHGYRLPGEDEDNL